MNKPSTRPWICFLLALVVFLGPHLGDSLTASPSRSQAVYDAVDTFTNFLVEDISEHDGTFGRTAVLVFVSDELDPDIRTYLHQRVETLLASSKKIEIIQCFSCEAVRGYSDGNKIIIEKGIPQASVAQQIASDLSLDNFMEVTLSHSGKALTLQVKIIGTSKSEVAWVKSYKVHALFISDRSFKFSLDIGSAVQVNPEAGADRSLFGATLFAGERFFGFGQVGLGFSSVFSTAHVDFNQTTGPHIEMNLNEVSDSYWSWGDLSVYTVPSYALSRKAVGFVLRNGLKLGFGHFTHAAIEYQHMVFAENEQKKYPSSIFFAVGFDLY